MKRNLHVGGTPEDEWALWELMNEMSQGVNDPLERFRVRLAVREAFLVETRVVARECPHCGAPVGNMDPDDPRVDEVVFVSCSDCRGLY